MGMGRNAMEVGSAAAKGGGGALQQAQGMSFLEVKASTAGVEHGANTALQAVQKAPDIAIKMATVGINTAIDLTKTVLTATGVGAPVTAAIDAVQTAVNKGIEKIQEGAKEGAAVTQKAASNMQWVTDPTHAGPMKQGMEELGKDVKGVTDTAQSIGKSAAGAAKGGSGGPEGGGEGMTPGVGGATEGASQDGASGMDIPGVDLTNMVTTQDTFLQPGGQEITVTQSMPKEAHEAMVALGGGVTSPSGQIDLSAIQDDAMVRIKEVGVNPASGTETTMTTTLSGAEYKARILQAEQPSEGGASPQPDCSPQAEASPESQVGDVGEGPGAGDGAPAGSGLPAPPHGQTDGFPGTKIGEKIRRPDSGPRPPDIDGEVVGKAAKSWTPKFGDRPVKVINASDVNVTQNGPSGDASAPGGGVPSGGGGTSA